MTSDTSAQRMAQLEARLSLMEDKMEIYQLLATYGPAVDSRTSKATADIWTPTGRYDFGAEPMVGAAEIGNLVNYETHLGYVEKGCAHVFGIPMVTVNGDRATATCYSCVYLHNGTQWEVERTSANRWELVRTEAGWKVENRINRLMNGTKDGPDLLVRGLADRPEGGSAHA